MPLAAVADLAQRPRRNLLLNFLFKILIFRGIEKLHYGDLEPVADLFKGYYTGILAFAV